MTRAMPVLLDISITCFMFLTVGAWGSFVRWKGEQSTVWFTLETSPSSKAIIIDIGFMTDPGS